MTELKEGWKVKLTTNKYAKVGKLVQLKGDEAVVEYLSRFGGNRTHETHAVKDLVHVCHETVYRDYSSSECGRIVKEGNLCGLHLGHKKRRERVEAERKERERLAKEYRDETALLRQNLEAQIDKRGLREIAPSLSVLKVREGIVSIKLDELLGLIRNA